MGHAKHRQRQADDAAVLGRDELDALHQVVAQGAHGEHAAAPRQVQDGVERGEQRADDHVDADRRRERHVLGPVDERRDAARAEALGQERREDVLRLVAQGGHEEVRAPHALVHQQSLVHAVSVQDEGVAQHLGEPLALQRVALDELGVDAVLGEAAGDGDAVPSAAGDDHVARARPALAHARQHAAHGRPVGHEEERVAGGHAQCRPTARSPARPGTRRRPAASRRAGAAGPRSACRPSACRGRPRRRPPGPGRRRTRARRSPPAWRRATRPRGRPRPPG